MEQEALQEHINRGREKKFSLPSSCSQVLFFTPILPNSDPLGYMHTCMLINIQRNPFFILINLKYKTCEHLDISIVLYMCHLARYGSYKEPIENTFNNCHAKWRLGVEGIHCWQPAPRWRLLPWLANPGNPAMSLHAEGRKVATVRLIKQWKEKGWMGETTSGWSPHT